MYSLFSKQAYHIIRWLSTVHRFVLDRRNDTLFYLDIIVLKELFEILRRAPRKALQLKLQLGKQPQKAGKKLLLYFAFFDIIYNWFYFSKG